ncbi:nascent polypeptide-associated complex subunit alpha, muscle-specific form-like [Sycon ciliatum]|uniref:nascent polypeptide-associated complex subunit alpha, muscle-specific form-like n=1 Tax=Sycon ciliatum TaxID=27933 RepID=UPI0031F62873
MATRTQRPRTPMQRCQQLCLFLCLILLAPANIRTANGTDSDKTSETDVAMDDDQEFSNSTCSQFTDPNGDVHYKPKNRSMDSLGVIVCHPGFQLSTSVQRRCIIVNNTRLDWSSDQHCVAIENFCPELAAGRFSLVLYTGHRRLGGEAVIVCNHSSVISIPYKRPRCKYDNASQTAVWSDIPNCQAPQTVIPTTVSSTMPTGPQATGTSSLSQSAVAVVICTCLILICVGAFILHLHRDAVLRTMQKIDTQNGAFLIINDTGKKVKSFLDKSLPATVSRRLRKDVDVDAENATAEEQQQQQKQQQQQDNTTPLGIIKIRSKASIDTVRSCDVPVRYQHGGGGGQADNGGGGTLRRSYSDLSADKRGGRGQHHQPPLRKSLSFPASHAQRAEQSRRSSIIESMHSDEEDQANLSQPSGLSAQQQPPQPIGSPAFPFKSATLPSVLSPVSSPLARIKRLVKSSSKESGVNPWSGVSTIMSKKIPDLALKGMSMRGRLSVPRKLRNSSTSSGRPTLSENDRENTSPPPLPAVRSGSETSLAGRVAVAGNSGCNETSLTGQAVSSKSVCSDISQAEQARVSRQSEITTTSHIPSEDERGSLAASGDTEDNKLSEQDETCENASNAAASVHSLADTHPAATAAAAAGEDDIYHNPLEEEVSLQPKKVPPPPPSSTPSIADGGRASTSSAGGGICTGVDGEEPKGDVASIASCDSLYLSAQDPRLASCASSSPSPKAATAASTAGSGLHPQSAAQSPRPPSGKGTPTASAASPAEDEEEDIYADCAERNMNSTESFTDLALLKQADPPAAAEAAATVVATTPAPVEAQADENVYEMDDEVSDVIQKANLTKAKKDMMKRTSTLIRDSKALDTAATKLKTLARQMTFGEGSSPAPGTPDKPRQLSIDASPTSVTASPTSLLRRIRESTRDKTKTRKDSPSQAAAASTYTARKLLPTPDAEEPPPLPATPADQKKRVSAASLIQESSSTDEEADGDDMYADLDQFKTS